MNRSTPPALGMSGYVPRRRGDEPDLELEIEAADGCSPAGAGMNRSPFVILYTGRHVPRRRGDEPLYRRAGHQSGECSPQARG